MNSRATEAPAAGSSERTAKGRIAEQRRVLESIAARQPLSRDADEIASEESGFWDRLADHVAAVGGSWPFIFGFFALLLTWMVLNTDVLSHWNMAFDPYPYIFLNLMLSMLAAIQAPIIMMSQNRAAQKDRIAAQHDFEVNLRAELEILSLHEKIDRLQQEDLRQVIAHQQRQIELLAHLTSSSTAGGLLSPPSTERL
jgi:uncharacterized membrane protein